MISMEMKYTLYNAVGDWVDDAVENGDLLQRPSDVVLDGIVKTVLLAFTEIKLMELASDEGDFVFKV